MALALLPNSVARSDRGEVRRNGVVWVQVYCASCSKIGPMVIKQHLRPGQLGQPTYSHYLCEGCFEKHGVVNGKQAIPDDVFWAEAYAVMIEEYGRVLTPIEIEIVLTDDQCTLSKLVRDRFSNSRFNGG